MNSLKTLCGVLSERSRVHPQRAALTSLYHEDGGTKASSCSYSELDQLSNSIAISLHELNIAKASVYITAMSDIKTAAAFFGALKAGCAPCVVTTNQLNSILESDEIGATAAAMPIIFDASCSPESLLAKNGNSGHVLLDYSQLINNLQSHDFRRDESTDAAYRVYEVERLKLGGYLSFGHDEIVRWLSHSAMKFDFSEGMSSLFWLPLAQSLGLYYGLILPIFTGGHALRITPEVLSRYPDQLLSTIHSKSVTTAGGPLEGLELSLLCMPDNGAPIDLGSLTKIILVGGFPKRADISGVKRRLSKLNYSGEVKSIFGTYFSPAGALTLYDSDKERNSGLLDENEWRLVNPITRNVCSSDDGGELLIHSDLISLQYRETNSHEYRWPGNDVRYFSTGYYLSFQRGVADSNGFYFDLIDKADNGTPQYSRQTTGLFKEEQSATLAHQAATATSGDEAVIIGISSVFPGSSNHHEFWSNLEQGRFSISEVPQDRWDWKSIHGKPDNTTHVTDVRWGGFVTSMDKFDAEFFGISSKEATFMDPMHRKLIESVWNCVEDAGIRMSDLAGKRVGVFVGISTFDYMQLTTRYNQFIHAYSGIGTLHCMAPNRISYMFDFTGPSEAIDTACSSSLVAAHRAVRSLRADECDMAIVCGANAILSDSIYIPLSNSNMLSKSGKCRTFDDSADGYVRGEGIASVLIVKK